MRNLMGYTDRISARPGERIEVRVSAEPGVASYRARLVRLWCVDSHRDGPGLEEEHLPAVLDRTFPARHQPIAIGSRAEVRHPALAGIGAFTLVLAVWPTLRKAEPQVVAAAGELVLGLADGRLFVALGGASIGAAPALPLREWSAVAVAHDPATGRARLVSAALHGFRRGCASFLEGALPGRAFGPAAAFVLAADRNGGACYNGKIEAPRLLAGVEPVDPVAALDPPAGQDWRGRLIAAWDFGRDMAGTEVPDLGPHGMHALLRNMPGRAMKGWRWDGSVHDWRQDPAQYGAIHFHEDDLGDCGWETDFALDLPADLPSGVYAARLDAGAEAEYVPFFVRCPASGPAAGARAVFLAATATYMAYANYRVMNRSNLYEMYLGQLPELVESDLYLNDHPELGDSLYASHADGSGVAISSRLRPILNMRPNSTLSAFNDDGWIWSFLRARGLACDMVTDEDLDREGLAALEGYALVVTGNHPEYTSTRMHDAFRAHLARGGRLLYLGGNGFYWRVAFHPVIPGLIELRRAEDGSRPWEAEPGEYHHAFNGELGGLWRRCGRPPQALVGVGMSASGFDVSSHYRRRPASRDPRAAFLFEGVEAEVIGAFGLAGGGAAGQELDRHDLALGSPRHALVLASSEDHTEEMMITKEDMPATNYMIGAPDNPLCRADMVFFETGAGGAVVSTGSITWAASLPWNGFDNDVARITENAFRRLCDPAPFPEPPEPAP